jgi:hypothetical protein
VTAGLSEANAKRLEQQRDEDEIAALINDAVTTCHNGYSFAQMPQDEEDKLTVYEENIAAEEDDKVKLTIAYSMTEYAASRLTTIKLATLQDEDQIDPATGAALQDLVSMQSRISSALDLKQSNT